MIETATLDGLVEGLKGVLQDAFGMTPGTIYPHLDVDKGALPVGVRMRMYAALGLPIGGEA